MAYMTQYVTWTRSNFRDVIRREVMDTNTRWFQNAEINQYLDDWLNDINQEYELVWAINTFTIGSSTGEYLIFNTSTFTPGMLRCEAVYYNSFRLAGRLLQNLEVGDPIWRSDLGIGTNVGTNTWDTPRISAMYPDSQNILIWPTPAPTSISGVPNVFTFEYPCLLSFPDDVTPSGLPLWTQWSAKSYVCMRLFQRPGPMNDLKKAARYKAGYERAKIRIVRMWHSFLPERFRRLQPASHYEWEILTPPPAWGEGTATATGT